jgi:release factor glutamine methyltransferase
VVVSNLPYIPTGSIPGLMPEVRDHDPLEALDGGPDGLDAFRSVVGELLAWLKPGGLLALEIGAEQADPCMELFGPHLAGARVTRDLAGLPRVLSGIMRGTR